MGKIVNTSESGHWYDIDGNAQHSQPYSDAWHKKNPGKQDEMRATTLRDAKKLGLLPSVTQVLKITAKPQLESWKIEQALLAAADNPFPGAPHPSVSREEAIAEWAKGVAIKSREKVDEAVDIGKKLHHTAEHHALSIKNGTVAPTPDMTVAGLWTPARTWLDGHLTQQGIHRAEFCVVGNGYAGTLDLWANVLQLGERIVDFKSRKWDPKKKPGIYPEDGTQLAAYRRAICDVTGQSILGSELGMTSVLINSEHEGCPVYVHDWTRDEIAYYDKRWQICHELWIHDKNYDPRS